jgi:hypothetical protein
VNKVGRVGIAHLGFLSKANAEISNKAMDKLKDVLTIFHS